MREYQCDFLIIGAGLAGSILGFLLRKSGKDVLMLEMLDAKEKDKLCGGMMNSRTFEEIKSVLGKEINDELSPRTPCCIYERYSGYETAQNGSFVSLSRKRLDDYVLNRYLESEGRLLDRMVVRKIDDEKGIAECEDMRSGEYIRVQYDILVGADGASSVTRRLTTGRAQRVNVTVEGLVPLLGQEIIFDYFNGALGYSWYIPWEKDAAVGSGIIVVDRDDGIISLREKLGEFCRELGIEVPKKLRGAPLPTGDDVLLTTGKRTYFVGDAAGLINGFTGGGIHYALRSARILAESLCSNGSYEEAMQPCVEEIARIFDKAKLYYFIKKLEIKKSGNPVTES